MRVGGNRSLNYVLRNLHETRGSQRAFDLEDVDRLGRPCKASRGVKGSSSKSSTASMEPFSRA